MSGHLWLSGWRPISRNERHSSPTSLPTKLRNSSGAGVSGGDPPNSRRPETGLCGCSWPSEDTEKQGQELNGLRAEVEAGKRGRLALVAPTAADVRDVVVEGPAGILATARPDFRPSYEPSKRRLVWPNGGIAMTFSADEPDRLRGPQHDGFWADEVAVWRYPEAWDNLLLSLRLGTDPRGVVTTTPKPVRVIRDLLADTSAPRDGRMLCVFNPASRLRFRRSKKRVATPNRPDVMMMANNPRPYLQYRP